MVRMVHFTTLLRISNIDCIWVANHLNGWFQMFQKWGNLDCIIFKIEIAEKAIPVLAGMLELFNNELFHWWYSKKLCFLWIYPGNPWNKFHPFRYRNIIVNTPSLCIMTQPNSLINDVTRKMFMRTVMPEIKEQKISACWLVHFLNCLRHYESTHRRDSIQGTDYIANYFFLNLRVSWTKNENLKWQIGGNIIPLTFRKFVT